MGSKSKIKNKVGAPSYVEPLNVDEALKREGLVLVDWNGVTQVQCIPLTPTPPTANHNPKPNPKPNLKPNPNPNPYTSKVQTELTKKESSLAQSSQNQISGTPVNGVASPDRPLGQSWRELLQYTPYVSGSGDGNGSDVATLATGDEPTTDSVSTGVYESSE